MSDHQRIRIHPEVEAPPPPTRPLVPRGSFRSEKGDPSTQPWQPQKGRKRSCCCKCMCWTVSLIVILFIIIAACTGILYLVFQPKIPKYSVDNLRISDLRVNPLDMSLYAKFNVRITAQNPNKKIGIYYERGSRLSVWYKTTKLCQGSLPKLYQGHQNTTVLGVALSGQSQYGNTLLSALQEAQQTGRVPLDLKIDVPVRIKVGRLKLMKVRILGDCMLIVNSLSTNSIISIKASTCKFKLKP
nr:NDR1/HIN1-like protein 6 [Ipomoea batatas]